MTATSATGRGGGYDVARRGIRGFTLIELLVVLMIMVMMASLYPMAVERLVPGRRLAATAQQLAAELRDLQSTALASGKSVTLAVADDGYKIDNGRGNVTAVRLPSGITLRLEREPNGAAPAGLTFFPDGSSTGGRFELQYGAVVRRLQVTQLLGRVRAEP